MTNKRSILLIFCVAACGAGRRDLPPGAAESSALKASPALCAPAPAPPGPAVPVFGPKEVVRSSGRPDRISATFDLPAGAVGPFLAVADSPDGVDSAVVSLNAKPLFGPSDFPIRGPSLRRQVQLVSKGNRLEVELRGKPGRRMRLSFFATAVGSSPVAVGPAGGVLSSDGVTVEIPPGALAAPTSLLLTVTRQGELPVITVEPHVEFVEPAVVTVSPALWTPTGPAFAYRIGETGDHLDDVEIVPQGARFSTYGFSSITFAYFLKLLGLPPFGPWPVNATLSWDKRSNAEESGVRERSFPNEDVCYASTSAAENRRCGDRSDCLDVRRHLVVVSKGPDGIVEGADRITDFASACGGMRPAEENVWTTPKVLEALAELQSRVEARFGITRRVWLNGATDSRTADRFRHSSGRAVDLGLVKIEGSSRDVKVERDSADLGTLAALAYDAFKAVARRPEMPDDVRVYVEREPDHVHVSFTARCLAPKSLWDGGKCVEPPGFLVSPSYVPADGVRGARLVSKESSGWKVSERSGVRAGSLDWKGWYRGGKPTKVLSWGAPGAFSRRHTTGLSSSIGGNSPEIFQNGELWAVAPGNVTGVALSRAGGGTLIAVCSIDRVDVVYTRPNEKSDSPALFDPVTAADGWREVGRYSDGVAQRFGTNAWFFNGEGTEAQTMRHVDLEPEKQARLTRLKLVLSGASASFSVVENSGGIVVERTTNDWVGWPPTPCVPNQEGAGQLDFRGEARQSGEYVVAVDYLDGKEVLAKIVGSGSGVSHATRSFTYKTHGCNNVERTDGDETKSYEGSFALTLVFGGQRIPIHEQSDSISSRIVFDPHGGSPKAAVARQIGTRRSLGTLDFLDLRHDLFAGQERDHSKLDYTQTYDGDSHAFCQQGLDVISQRQSVKLGPRTFDVMVQDLGGQNESCYETFNPGAIWNLGPDLATGMAIDNGTLIPGLAASSFGMRAMEGSWVVDSAGGLAVSQQRMDLDGFFNTLSDGDLTVVIPGGSTASSYHPILLVR